MAFNINESIQVAIRGRPADGDPCVDFNSALKQIIVRDNEDKQFNFNYVFNPDVSQKTIFETLAKPVLEQFINGSNGCIMAYGQTGSGKTFTMGTGRTNDDDEKGIIPRLMEELFVALENNKRYDDYEIIVSFIEVYNNEVLDLLNSESMKINVREDKTGLKLPDLCEKTVNTFEEALKHLEYGINLRKTSSTVGNSTSSRSHAIFTIRMELKKPIPLKCRLQLVDLAGSESADTWNLKSVAREGKNINTSLLVLGNVIKALKEKQNHVPYRGSILTRILQESLGGHSSTLLIGCVNPKANSAAETTNTLRFASKACGIERKIMKNSLSRSTIKRTMPKNNLFSKPTPCKSLRFGIQTPERDFTSPLCNRVLAKLEKKLFSTPNIEKFASRIMERTAEKQFSASIAETTLISEQTTEKPDLTFNNFSDEPITGLAMLPAVSKTPPLCENNENSVKNEEISQEYQFAMPQIMTRKRRNIEKNSILDSSNMKTQNSFVLPESMTTPMGKHRFSTVLVPETSFYNTRYSVRARKRSVEKENVEMSFDVLCTPNLMSNQTAVACKNSCEILPSPRRGWKIQINGDVQEKNNQEILKMLNSSMDVLKALPTIGPKTAEIICQWRKDHGKFKNISDLQKVDRLQKTFYKRFVRATLVNHIDI